MGMEKGTNHNEFLNFQCKRNILGLAKSFLVILEELKSENLLSEPSYQKLRGQILSQSNDKIRDLEDTISRFTVELNKN